MVCSSNVVSHLDQELLDTKVLLRMKDLRASRPRPGCEKYHSSILKLRAALHENMAEDAELSKIVETIHGSDNALENSQRKQEIDQLKNITNTLVVYLRQLDVTRDSSLSMNQRCERVNLTPLGPSLETNKGGDQMKFESATTVTGNQGRNDQITSYTSSLAGHSYSTITSKGEFLVSPSFFKLPKCQTTVKDKLQRTLHGGVGERQIFNKALRFQNS